MTEEHISIIIKPTLIYDHQMIHNFADKVRSGRVTKEDKIAFFVNIKKSYNNMVKRIDKYISLLERFMTQRDWRLEYLEVIGEAILKYAFKNASTGYVGSEALDAAGIHWDERDELTEELYRIRYNNVPEGLTTGANQLLDSLRIGDTFNIFEAKPDVGTVTVGTRWPHAKTLEKGGWKKGPHLGINKTGTAPAEWLIRAIGKKEAWDLFYKISERFIQFATPIPPRPYLKPALWYVKQKGEAVNALISIFVDNLQRTVDNSERWSLGLDEMEIRTQS